MAVASATHTVESAVFDCTIQKLWPYIKVLDFPSLYPERVSSSKWIEGGPNQVGSVLRLTFVDGHTWDFRISELSDLHFFISFELVAAEPPVQVSSMHQCLSLRRVTKTDQVFVKWSTDFSNDADANLIQDNKYKKFENFDSWAKVLPSLK